MNTPPVSFTNAITDAKPDFDYAEWRKSPEWRLYVAGYNEAVRVANERIQNQYNLGETAQRIFGGGN